MNSAITVENLSKQYRIGVNRAKGYRTLRESLSGAAKWSGTELKKGTRASMNSVKAIGGGVKAGGHEVNKWFRDIGDGIKDVELKL